MKIINENCDRELANDRTLPYTAYLVSYEVDAVMTYDIEKDLKVGSNLKVE
jgi:hypothetical protein